jgi:hypothetical protein
MAVAQKKLLGPESKIFTMGSCFALEVRNALTRRGLAVYPDYARIPYDPTTQILDKIPLRSSLAHFDTFVMRQEFERAFGLWTDREASFCTVVNGHANNVLQAAVAWQDPTRKLVYATTPELLKQLSDAIDDALREGIAEADVLVLTLGLTEVWHHKVTGRYLCMPPGAGYGGAEDLGIFELSSYEQNYANVCAILDMVKERYPEKQVVISVSPIHLERTYAPTDIGTASMESKSILRAVAGAISRAYPHVTYFPAYEMAHFWRVPVFLEDGRHVRRDFAERVVSGFINAFS